LAVTTADEPGDVVIRTGGYLEIERRGSVRRVPTAGGLTRRRWAITTTKFLLPAVSLLLLGTIALWPEYERATDTARIAIQGLRAALDGARLTNAHYKGVDERGRPYTVTAATATQRDAGQVDMTSPNGDMTLENGTWIDVKSKLGVYMRKEQQLDLYDDVVLYRDDGMTMTTSSATVDVKGGAASSAAPTHVEGPFGTLDAQGFTTVDKGTAIQFWGPAHVLLNAASQ
jgi:lipopolysaccharide export system protein LptC